MQREREQPFGGTTQKEHSAQAESLSPTERALPTMLSLGACVPITLLRGRLLSLPTPSPTAAGTLCAAIWLAMALSATLFKVQARAGMWPGVAEAPACNSCGDGMKTWVQELVNWAREQAVMEERFAELRSGCAMRWLGR